MAVNVISVTINVSKFKIKKTLNEKVYSELTSIAD